MSIDQQHRHAEMQAQMTVALEKLRQEVVTQMGDTVERMQKRPRLKGDQALPTIAGDSRLNRDDSGSMILDAAIGVPGLSSGVEAVMNVATELYGSRDATRARPQDKKDLSFKEMASIRDKNKQDLSLYHMLGEKLNLITTYIASGYKKALQTKDGAIIGVEPDQEHKFDMKEKYRPDNENEYDLSVKYRPDNNNKASISAPKIA